MSTKKMLRICIVALGLAFWLFAFSVKAKAGVSEAWVARSDGPGDIVIPPALAVDSAGNVYVAGGTDAVSFPHFDYTTIKYASNGQQQWSALYDGPSSSDDYANDIAIDAGGNVYVTGRSGWPGIDYATVKYDDNGVEQWVARYDGPAGNVNDIAEAIALDEAGNVYVTGYSVDPISHYDYATIKYDGDGVEQWVARYHGIYDDYATSIAVDEAGNVYVTGYSTGDYYDYATIKYDGDGIEQWVARYDGPADLAADYARDIAIDAEGNVYVTGSSEYESSLESIATVKYDNDGVEQWVVRPDDSRGDAVSLALDAAGNVYVTGTGDCSSSAIPNLDYITIKYGSDGVEQWLTWYDGVGEGDDWPACIAVDNSGNVYVTGRAEGSSVTDEYATVKYDGNGQEQWVVRYEGPENYYFNRPSFIAVDESDNVYVTGTSGGDYATVKYVQSDDDNPGDDDSDDDDASSPDSDDENDARPHDEDDGGGVCGS